MVPLLEAGTVPLLAPPLLARGFPCGAASSHIPSSGTDNTVDH
jgi:hypothetical protein